MNFGDYGLGVFDAPPPVPLDRLRGGGNSASSSLNVIFWRHEYGLLKLASLLSVILQKPMI